MKQSKINRLPDSVQMILNGRIENNEAGAEILKWLNELPEVKEVLDLHFDGKAVSKQNLSAWRRTGFPLWQAREGMVAGEAVKDSKGCQDSGEAGPAGETEGGHRLTQMNTDKMGAEGINAKTQGSEGTEGAGEGVIYEGSQGW